MVKIAIFASGQGTNTVNLIQFFEKHKEARVTLVITNNPSAPVIQRAKSFNVETMIINDVELNSDDFIATLKERGISFIVLAGFLKLIPVALISTFENCIINIHPALLPKFGGKGMYGLNVHKAVIEAGEEYTGITIHFVDQQFDQGKIIESYQLKVEKTDTPLTLKDKVRELELKYLPIEVEKLISKI